MSNGFNFQQMPFPFFPFGCAGAEQGAEKGQEQPNGFPFMFPFGNMSMPQMPFPFYPFGCTGAEQGAEKGQEQQGPGCKFPFPFTISGMDRGNGDKADRQSVFSLLGVDLPNWALQKLLQLDASPKTLEKLQKVLDLVFSVIPEKDASEEEEEA